MTMESSARSHDTKAMTSVSVSAALQSNPICSISASWKEIKCKSWGRVEEGGGGAQEVKTKDPLFQRRFISLPSGPSVFKEGVKGASAPLLALVLWPRPTCSQSLPTQQRCLVRNIQTELNSRKSMRVPVKGINSPAMDLLTSGHHNSQHRLRVYRRKIHSHNWKCLKLMQAFVQFRQKIQHMIYPPHLGTLGVKRFNFHICFNSSIISHLALLRVLSLISVFMPFPSTRTATQRDLLSSHLSNILTINPSFINQRGHVRWPILLAANLTNLRYIVIGICVAKYENFSLFFLNGEIMMHNRVYSEVYCQTQISCLPYISLSQLYDSVVWRIIAKQVWSSADMSIWGF